MNGRHQPARYAAGMDWSSIGWVIFVLAAAMLVNRAADAISDQQYETRKLLETIAERLWRLESISRAVADIEDRQRRLAGEESRSERIARYEREYKESLKSLDDEAH